jgi:hypothetical protein
VIETDDGTSRPFLIAAPNGSKAWYLAAAVRLADGSSTGASTGEWRDQAVTKKYCSRAGDPEGAICEHGSDIIRESHWSCCGALSRESACTKVPCGVLRRGVVWCGVLCCAEGDALGRFWTCPCFA